MKTLLKIITLVAFLALLAGPAAASTVLYGQSPNPNGWDVAWDSGFTLADDWVWTGPYAALVYDFHIWNSWIADDFGTVSSVTISIWDDTGVAPGSLLKSYEFSNPPEPDFYGSGEQGWYNPIQGYSFPYGSSEDYDHENIYLSSFVVDPLDAFLAQPGVTYWLAVNVVPEGETQSPGWKTSLEGSSTNAAVYFKEGAWHSLYDPSLSEPLNLAFEVTGQMVPAPPALLLLGPGLMLVWGYRRRRS